MNIFRSLWLLITRKRKLIVVLCPYHTEKTPSCVIDIEKETFACYGCGVKGVLGTEWRDALKRELEEE